MKALVVYGGWDGHQPREVGQLLARTLREDGFDVDLSDSLDALSDNRRLEGLNLLVPHWTMGKITEAQLNPVLRAVRDGVGIAGCHGGMCDAFRESILRERRADFYLRVRQATERWLDENTPVAR